MLSARRWPTRLTLDQFAEVTGLEEYPEYLKDDVGPDSVLAVVPSGSVALIARVEAGGVVPAAATLRSLVSSH